ncbi:MAG: PEFG-CTERM sorting domain-containing protein [Nitrosopumilus sp.]|nr:PEFG-CTERM sorting domain-containing protein [Nitrosopumilus sp.]NRA05158.1 PEFG-CTERM sorting domain-containing protein [Nitrosopumilus sp.]
MEYRIVYSLISLLIISTGTVFAQGSLISVQTDDNNYDESDTIVISGMVTTVIGETPITLQLFSEGNLVDIAQIVVAQDGSYSHTVIAEGPLWKKVGTYTVRVSYGEGNIAESEFSYTPKSESIETTTNFEVDAGSSGTFDVEYTIKGGTVKDMIVDSDIFAIIVQIESTDEGVISLDLPREFIGAEKQDGKDDTFIILIDGIEVAYQESVVHSDSRVITINFENGDSDIEIIGTYVIPEFGAIAMAMMIIGIMTIIFISKSKLQIKI